MDKILSSIISKNYAVKNCVFPVEINDEEIRVQMCDYDIDIINDLRGFSKRRVIVDKKSKEEIVKNISLNYLKEGDEKDYTDLVLELIKNAVDQYASDIHIEPMSSDLRIRYRVEGDLKTVNRLSLKDYPEINTIIKLKSGLNITEKRLPQDGRMSLDVEDYNVDIRVSVIPRINDEKIVLRLLDRKKFIRPLESLGFSKYAVGIVREILSLKSGILIISGPTGSGKSTTVYSILKELSNNDINITTIEDPVEYKMEGINQVQINTKLGLDFSTGLRSILRQDPDVIILGEIRDVESAKIAIRAAITGHFVLATLHTNDAISTIIRLKEMGVEPYLIKAALVGVISQRLVKKTIAKKISIKKYDKKICENICGESLKTDEDTVDKNIEVYDKRILIYEVIRIDDEIKSEIVQDFDEKKIYNIAKNNGMISYEDSIK